MPGSYLVLELNNRCSLACVHCSVSEGAAHPHHQQTGMLDPALAAALFADLQACGARFDALILFWLGEPLLHPQFADIWRAGLRAAAAGCFAKVEVHSNATHLHPERADTLLNRAPIEQPLHFSLDAATSETYLRVKGKDRFAAVEANIAAFLSRKAARGAPWPRPVFQFIVGENNHREAAAFRDRWERRCRDLGLPVRAAAGHVPAGADAVVFFRQLDAPDPASQQRSNDVYQAAMAALGLDLPVAAAPRHTALRTGTGLAACSGFWKSPVVSWNGDVTACTRDSRLENRLGNLSDQPFSALWWGSAQAARRRQVAAGDYTGLPGCAGCFIPHSLNYTELLPADVARQGAWDQRQQA